MVLISTAPANLLGIWWELVQIELGQWWRLGPEPSALLGVQGSETAWWSLPSFLPLGTGVGLSFHV